MLFVRIVRQVGPAALVVGDVGLGFRIAHARVHAQLAPQNLAAKVRLDEGGADLFHGGEAVRRGKCAIGIERVRIEVAVRVIAVEGGPVTWPAGADIEVVDRQGRRHAGPHAGRTHLVDLRGPVRRAVAPVDVLGGFDIHHAALQPPGPCARQVVVVVGDQARLAALVEFTQQPGRVGEAGEIAGIGIAGRRGQRWIDVVAAVVDGRGDAEDLARQFGACALGLAGVVADLAGQGQLVGGFPLRVQGVVAKARLVSAVQGAAAVGRIAEGAGQQVRGRIDFHVDRHQPVVIIGARRCGGTTGFGGARAADQDPKENLVALVLQLRVQRIERQVQGRRLVLQRRHHAVARALVARSIETVDARQQRIVDLLAGVTRQVGARVVIVKRQREVAAHRRLAAKRRAVVAARRFETGPVVGAARVRAAHQQAPLAPGLGHQREAHRVDLLRRGVVAGRGAIAHRALRIVERARALQIDHAAQTAFGQLGQWRFIKVDAAEQFRREHVVVEAARRAADTAGGRGVDRRAVQRRHRIRGRQAADRNALPLARAFVAHQDHAWHALQRFGDVRLGEFTDVLGHDRIPYADGLLLEVQRLLQAGAKARHHDGSDGGVGGRGRSARWRDRSRCCIFLCVGRRLGMRLGTVGRCQRERQLRY